MSTYRNFILVKTIDTQAISLFIFQKARGDNTPLALNFLEEIPLVYSKFRQVIKLYRKI